LLSAKKEDRARSNSERGLVSLSGHHRSTVGGLRFPDPAHRVVGGISIGSIAAARRTESSYPAFLAGTNPSDLDIDIGEYNPAVLREIKHLPQVTALESWVSPNAGLITSSGLLRATALGSQVSLEGSVNGLYFNQDKVTIVDGRMADPARADEVIVNKFAAQHYGLQVGQKPRYGFFSNSQLGADGVPTGPAHTTVNVRIVGIGIFNDEVVQDQIDRNPALVLAPALTRQVVGCCVSFAWSGLKLRDGSSDVAAVESEYLHLLPAGDPYYFHVTSVIEAEAEAEQAVKPESIALGVFGLIAALTALFIAALGHSPSPGDSCAGCRPFHRRLDGRLFRLVAFRRPGRSGDRRKSGCECRAAAPLRP
jgi:hypothetical protein